MEVLHVSVNSADTILSGAIVEVHADPIQVQDCGNQSTGKTKVHQQAWLVCWIFNLILDTSDSEDRYYHAEVKDEDFDWSRVDAKPLVRLWSAIHDVKDIY